MLLTIELGLCYHTFDFVLNLKKIDGRYHEPSLIYIKVQYDATAATCATSV